MEDKWLSMITTMWYQIEKKKKIIEEKKKREEWKPSDKVG